MNVRKLVVSVTTLVLLTLALATYQVWTSADLPGEVEILGAIGIQLRLDKTRLQPPASLAMECALEDWYFLGLGQLREKRVLTHGWEFRLCDDPSQVGTAELIIADYVAEGGTSFSHGPSEEYSLPLYLVARPMTWYGRLRLKLGPTRRRFE